MDSEVLKKKLSTFKTTKGTLKNVSNDLLVEILNAWERWEGTVKSFYTSIGTTYSQMGSLMGKAKKLKREGHYVETEFHEIQIDPQYSSAPGCHIELAWEDGKIIKFGQVDVLLEFLKKAA